MPEPPYGYRLTEVQHEREAIALIHELRDQGLSLGAIAKELDRHGYRPRGVKWYRSRIRQILERRET